MEQVIDAAYRIVARLSVVIDDILTKNLTKRNQTIRRIESMFFIVSYRIDKWWQLIELARTLLAFRFIALRLVTTNRIDKGPPNLQSMVDV